MSIRVDSSSWIPGAIVVGNRGLGILADNIPATGDAGPSFLFNDVALPADSGKEVCGRVTSWPSAGTLLTYEDGSFEFSGGPDNTYSFAYTLFVDGVSQGTGTVSLQVGSPVASFAQTTGDTAAAFGAVSKPTAAFTLSTDSATFAGGAGTTTSAGFSLQTADTTFSGGALVSGAPASAGFNIQLDGATAVFNALSSPVSSFAQTTADATFSGSAGTLSEFGFSVGTDDATFAGGAYCAPAAGMATTTANSVFTGSAAGGIIPRQNPFERMHSRLLARLGGTAIIRGYETCTVNIEYGVEVSYSAGDDKFVRSEYAATVDVANILNTAQPKPGDTLTVGAKNYVIDAIASDNGFMSRCVLVSA